MIGGEEILTEDKVTVMNPANKEDVIGEAVTCRQ